MWFHCSYARHPENLQNLGNLVKTSFKMTLATILIFDMVIKLTDCVLTFKLQTATRYANIIFDAKLSAVNFNNEMS